MQREITNYFGFGLPNRLQIKEESVNAELFHSSKRLIFYLSLFTHEILKENYKNDARDCRCSVRVEILFSQDFRHMNADGSFLEAKMNFVLPMEISRRFSRETKNAFTYTIAAKNSQSKMRETIFSFFLIMSVLMSVNRERRSCRKKDEPRKKSQ